MCEMKDNKIKHPGIGGVIMAGGKNSRMGGRKKIFLTMDGETFLDILRKRLSSMQEIYLSVEEEGPYLGILQQRDASDMQGDQAGGLGGLRLVPDLYPGIGPLGGIASVLKACKEEAVFVIAGDTPFLREETIDRICQEYEQHPDKITIAQCGQKLHPLCGLYPKAALPIFEEHIARGDYKMLNLLNGFGMHIVTFPEDDPSFQNVNSVSEYRKLRGDQLLQLEDAVNVLATAVRPINETEEISLLEGAGKVLAEDVTAPMDQPPFARSPLDGYAVRGEDTRGASKEKPVTLKVVGKIYAGEVFSGKIEENECVRLMTGAPIPEGANAVIRQENTDYGEDYVQIYEELTPWKNYCYAGEDYKKGDLLVKKETLLHGQSIGVIAGTGRDQVKVYREPAITVISTGSELLAPGDPLVAGKIYDSNRYLVVGRLHDLGLKGICSDHCKDDVEEMCRRIREAASSSDLIITTGGVSVGEKDIMHEVLEQLGGEKLFWRVSLKPGAPTLAFVLNRNDSDPKQALETSVTPGNLNNNKDTTSQGQQENQGFVTSVMSRSSRDYKDNTSQVHQENHVPGSKHKGVDDYKNPCLVICLTGNPYGVAVNFELLVRPVLARLTRKESLLSKRAHAILENDSPKRGGVRRFMRGFYQDDHVRILAGSHASGTLASMVACNCLVEIPKNGSGKKGEKVWVYPL